MKQPRHWSYHEEKQLRSILRRDNWECQIRGPHCLGTANSVDHIHPKAWGGRATPDNLRAACKPCNQRKGARSQTAFFSSGGHRRAPLLKIPPSRGWLVVASDYSRRQADDGDSAG